MIKVNNKQVNKMVINNKEVLKVVLNGATKYQKNTIQWSCPYSGNIQANTYTGTSWYTISSEQNTLYCFTLASKGTSSSNSSLQFYRNGSWNYFSYAYIAIWNPITGYIHFPYNGTIYYLDNITGIRLRGGSSSSSTSKIIRVDLTNMNGNISTIGGVNGASSATDVACNTAGLLKQSKLILALANTGSGVTLSTDANSTPFSIYNNGYIDILYAQPYQADSNRVQIGLRQADSATSTTIRSETQTLLIEQIPSYANTKFTIAGNSWYGAGDLMVVQID